MDGPTAAAGGRAPSRDRAAPVPPAGFFWASFQGDTDDSGTLGAGAPAASVPVRVNRQESFQCHHPSSPGHGPLTGLFTESRVAP